jgi:predicted metal-binding membrane protein
MTRGLWWCTAGISAMAPSAAVLGQGGLDSIAASAAAGLPMWTLMSIAMMLPGAIPAVRRVALNTSRRGRRRAISKFLVVYLGVWAAFGAVVLALLAVWKPANAELAVAAVLALAAAWQMTPLKRHALEACRRSTLPASGSAAAAPVARFGLRNGVACVGSCWAMMLAMAIATSGRLFWTAAITCIVSIEKLARTSRRATNCAAAFLGCSALGVAILAVVG